MMGFKVLDLASAITCGFMLRKPFIGLYSQAIFAVTDDQIDCAVYSNLPCI
jgi:hypothetical protein